MFLITNMKLCKKIFHSRASFQSEIKVSTAAFQEVAAPSSAA